MNACPGTCTEFVPGARVNAVQVGTAILDA